MVFADLSIKKELEADLAKMNEERPNSAMFVKLDVTSENDWKAAMKTVHAKFGKMDVIVNNAGIASTWNIEKETLAGLSNSNFYLLFINFLIKKKTKQDSRKFKQSTLKESSWAQNTPLKQ